MNDDQTSAFFDREANVVYSIREVGKFSESLYNKPVKNCFFFLCFTLKNFFGRMFYFILSFLLIAPRDIVICAYDHPPVFHKESEDCTRSPSDIPFITQPITMHLFREEIDDILNRPEQQQALHRFWVI